ncbi:hypothetical protein NHL50_12775 [Acidimicrobiia bacterium EGI L10123]|uniref:hypothetical protein n=1 Tax=Salinilacustrithrix flava TaxID=2957203 RepID=UPI003D7C1A5A|nr:hypothetical protein [Acidimicrobiia bacterium EGI L10123]
MELRQRLAEHLPMFGLEVRTPRLLLRYPDDEDALALAELGAMGVHDPGTQPFSILWTSVPPPHQQRNTLAVREGEAVVMEGFVMDRADWEPHRRDDIELVGADAVAALFGTERPPGS